MWILSEDPEIYEPGVPNKEYIRAERDACVFFVIIYNCQQEEGGGGQWH